jgi:hypothetical protein
MRRFVGFSALAIMLTGSPLQASTLTFENEIFANFNSFVFSPFNAAVTVTNWGINRLVVSGGGLPGQYDVDGPVPSLDDEGGEGALELFVDGCVPFGTIITLGYNCTPTAASYLQIVGSIPDLGLSQQALFVGNVIGGAPERFPFPTTLSKSVQGGGTALLSIPLSQALGVDPASEWQFTFNVYSGPAFGPPTAESVKRVIATDGASAVVPEPASLALLGTGGLVCARRLRRRGR